MANRELFHKIKYTTQRKPKPLAKTPRGKALGGEADASLPCRFKNNPFLQEVNDAWIAYNLKVPGAAPRTWASIRRLVGRLRKGTMFNGTEYEEDFGGYEFTVEEIKSAIDNFAKALDPDYYPENKKFLMSLNLRSFIFREFAPVGRRSIFLQYFSQAPQLIPKNEFPILAKRLMFLYKSEILGNRHATITKKQEETFFAASSKIVKYLQDNKSRINIAFRKASDRDKADWAFEAAQESWNGKPFKPYLFTSEYFFTSDFPVYLYHQNIFIKE